MPKATVDQLNAKTETLKTKLAEKGESMEGPEVRALKKKIRRIQRKRRSLVASEARATAATKEKPATAPAAEEKKEEETAEEKKEE
jgi:hypothetical protein